MPRGYRCIVLAAVGWLSLGAEHPNPSAKTEQAQPDRRVGDALSNIAKTYHEQTERAERSPESQPCKAGDDQRDSDLCAQWKAADAAEKAAWWAAFAGWFGGLSFLGVLAAIGLAFHSNWIARDSARRQLRAYISVEPKGILVDPDGSFQSTMLVTNRGQTPAFSMNAANFIGYDESPSWFKPNWEYDSARIESEFVLGPGQTMHIYAIIRSFDMERQKLVRDKKIAIIHYGAVFYRDAFGTFRETEFTNYYWGELLDDKSALRSRAGNNAT